MYCTNTLGVHTWYTPTTNWQMENKLLPHLLDQSLIPTMILSWTAKNIAPERVHEEKSQKKSESQKMPEDVNPNDDLTFCFCLKNFKSVEDKERHLVEFHKQSSVDIEKNSSKNLENKKISNARGTQTNKNEEKSKKKSECHKMPKDINPNDDLTCLLCYKHYKSVKAKDKHLVEFHKQKNSSVDIENKPSINYKKSPNVDYTRRRLKNSDFLNVTKTNSTKRKITEDTNIEKPSKRKRTKKSQG